MQKMILLIKTLKGQLHEILWFPIYELAEIFDFLDPAALWAAAANLAIRMLWATAANLAMRLGHYGKFGCILWATAENLVMRYGPLRQIWLYTMGNCRKFGDALWATAANLVMRFGPLWQIWSCAMGRCG
jgi:hypothetical protein